MLVFIEDTGTLEGKGIMHTASMANSIVHNDKQIGKGYKLVEGQVVMV